MVPLGVCPCPAGADVAHVAAADASRSPVAVSGAAPAFVALRHRNFRLLWVGQLVSLSGTMMQSAAILWHIALLAPPGWKALSLGMVGLARIGPILVFGLWSGVVADAVDRRKLMLIAQTVMMLAATSLAVVTVTGLANAWVILAIAGVGAAAGAADGPISEADADRADRDDAGGHQPRSRDGDGSGQRVGHPRDRGRRRRGRRGRRADLGS